MREPSTKKPGKPNDKIFWWILIVITFLGFILRFWRFPDRYGLAYDQAHDAIVARVALEKGKLPLLGPFSSAGPFQTSGTWYWLIMIGTAIAPNFLVSPWIFLTILYGLLPFGMGLLGKRLGGPMLGFLSAILTAISTAQIAQSVSLTNQTPIALCSFMVLWSAVLYLQTKRPVYGFLLAFGVALAISVHLQGAALGVVLLTVLVLAGRPTFRQLVSCLAGLVLPSLPLFYYDSRHDFINISSMIKYYTKDQFAISLDVLGRRWLTYISQFWPREWAHIIGGEPIVSIVLGIFTLYFFFLLLVSGRLKKEWLAFFLSFFAMVVLVRYTRVPLFASFIVFFHPFILLISAWTLLQIFAKHRMLGAAMLIIVVVATSIHSYREITRGSNDAAMYGRNVAIALKKQFPGQSFAVYDYSYRFVSSSFPLILHLYTDGMIDDGGHKIGIGYREPPLTDWPRLVIGGKESLPVYDLESSSAGQLTESSWAFVNPSQVYRSTEDWLDQ